MLNGGPTNSQHSETLLYDYRLPGETDKESSTRETAEQLCPYGKGKVRFVAEEGMTGSQ